LDDHVVLYDFENVSARSMAATRSGGHMWQRCWRDDIVCFYIILVVREKKASV
jgi:hypothetical protein